MAKRQTETVYRSGALVINVGEGEETWLINPAQKGGCYLIVEPTTDGGFRCTTRWVHYEMPTNPHETTFLCLSQAPVHTVDVTNHTERRPRSRESRLNSRHRIA